MYPLNDNDLDRLSRDAADQYDVESSTSGWEALENRLNKELPLKEEKERRRFLFWLFFIVLLAGGGLLWMMTGKNNPAIQVAHTDSVPVHNEPKNTTPAANQPSPNVGISPDGTTRPAPADATTAPADAATTPATITPGAKAAPQQQADPSLANDNDNARIAPAHVTEKNKIKTTAPQKTGNLDKPGVAHNEISTGRGAKNTKGKNNRAGIKNGRQQDIITVDHMADPVQKADNSKPGGQDAASEHEFKASMVSAVGLETTRRAIIGPPLQVPAETEKPAPKKKEQKNKGFEIGLAVGPDMSNVKFTNMDKAGYNAGLQLGYRFNDRWSVNTGLLYTRKNYTVQGKDFTKPNNSWWQNRELHGVQGYCAMFDIPLNIRHDFSVNKKQRWFASVGASSYIMTREDYTYDYSYAGSSTIRQSYWESDSTSTYLFSIFNLSAGFERALNKRFSLQVEPYFKFPLKGLGYGKLDLNSYGIYFSLKYKLGK
jgi:cytoskeletal protein RodZ